MHRKPCDLRFTAKVVAGQRLPLPARQRLGKLRLGKVEPTFVAVGERILLMCQPEQIDEAALFAWTVEARTPPRGPRKMEGARARRGWAVSMTLHLIAAAIVLGIAIWIGPAPAGGSRAH